MLSLENVRDDDLLRQLATLVKRSRGVEAEVVAHIGEVERRRLYAREACSSMFEYCRRVLCLRENEAYLRITVARAARQKPVLLEMLRDGRLHLSGIARLAPHLTRENAESVLERATGMSHREIRELVAELEPRPDVAPLVRKLPERLPRVVESLGKAPESLHEPPGSLHEPPGSLHESPESLHESPESLHESPESRDRLPETPAVGSGSPLQLGAPRVDSVAGRIDSAAIDGDSRAGLLELRETTPARPALVEPLAPGRFLVRFTASGELRDKLERLQALMRASVPDGDLARIIDVAVSEKLQRVEARRFGQTKAPRSGATADRLPDPRPSSRHIPAAVRRLVYERDGGRCAYRDQRGLRCARRHDLEFHHRHPFGLGGDHSAHNLALMCRAHNTLLAEQDYGEDVAARFRASASRAAAPVDADGTRIVVQPPRSHSG